MNDLQPINFPGLDPRRPLVIAGPCSAETEEQVIETARELAAEGFKLFRAGLWKPRTKPGGFEGVGVDGIAWLQRVKRETGMYTATEVATRKHVLAALEGDIDMIWIGARTTANPFAMQEIADALRGQLLSGKALTGLSADVSYTVRQHTETGLYLVLQQPQPLSAGTLRLLYSVSVLCALACIILSVVLSLQLSRQVFQPIGRLHHAIRQVGKNNLDVQVPVPAGRHDELGELAQQFNTMVVALRHNQQALLENQRALNRAQIRMLQAQLNPHFLCNTLDTMKWISKINQVPQVALMSTNLADILRFCITPDEFVPLRRELEILSRYVEIQRIRLSESFSYTEAVPEALLSCMVPKMLLQPLAENAILHGLSGVEHGELSVTAVLAEQDVLEIRVRDNGCGFPPDLLGPYKPPETQTGHLGLLNVDTILRKHYGDAFGLRLENPEGGGACILARLPAKGGPGV